MAAEALEDISSVTHLLTRQDLAQPQPSQTYPSNPVPYCTKTPVECFLHIPFSPPNDQPISILISISISISTCTCVRILSSSYLFYKLFVRNFGLNSIALCRCCARTFVCSRIYCPPPFLVSKKRCLNDKSAQSVPGTESSRAPAADCEALPIRTPQFLPPPTFQHLCHCRRLNSTCAPTLIAFIRIVGVAPNQSQRPVYHFVAATLPAQSLLHNPKSSRNVNNHLGEASYLEPWTILDKS